MSRALPLCVLVLLCAALTGGCKKKKPPADDGGPDAGARPDGQPVLGKRTADDKKEAVRRLRQIANAMHNFEGANGGFPAGVVGPNGQLGLSWRVALLPHVNEGQLYSEFKLSEPWDSEHNKKLVYRMPKVFETPGTVLSNGKTFLRSFSGPFAFIPATPTGQAARPFVAAWNKQPPGSLARGPRIIAITDGVSNTLMVAEAAEAVEWTKPEDIEFLDRPGTPGAPQSPLPRLGGPFFDGGFHGLFCDGAVRFLSSRMSEQNLRGMITTNGGEVLTE